MFLLVYFDGVIIHMNICILFVKTLFKKYQNAKYLISLPRDNICDLIKMKYHLQIGIMGCLTPSPHVTKLSSLRSLVRKLLVYLN